MNGSAYLLRLLAPVIRTVLDMMRLLSLDEVVGAA